MVAAAWRLEDSLFRSLKRRRESLGPSFSPLSGCLFRVQSLNQ